MSNLPYLYEAAGWDSLPNLLNVECEQSVQEGRDAKALDRLREGVDRMSAQELVDLHARMLELPISEDFPFDEPSDLAGIRKLRTPAPSLDRPDLSEAKLYDQLYGAWLGRCCGCALGKPVEGYMQTLNGLGSWERQKHYLLGISPDEWPLRDYFPGHSPAASTTGELMCPDSTRGRIRFMESDDDIRYTVLGQILLAEKGYHFSSEDVASAWFYYLPYLTVCTAETQAYRNLVAIAGRRLDTLKPDTIDWHWVATHLNPYREWIGAQIRVDSYGYACPGNPERAAELAWRDARVSHVKNGLYGAMFCAAMIAASFVNCDPHVIVEAGLAQIPRTSRLYADIRQAIAICERHGCSFDAFEAIIKDLHAAFGHYDPVHTNNNAAVCAAALLVSGGDFHQGITFAVMGGWDTDCNGATVGSMVGILNGAADIPRHWTERLNDTLRSQIADYHPIAISKCAQRAARIVLKNTERL